MTRISPLTIAPLAIFAGLASLFYAGMIRDRPDELPSVFIGKSAPATPGAALEGRAPLTDADLRSGEVTIVNFWASWCPPCRAEHPTLHRLSAQGHRLYGVNFKDSPEQANAYLDENGDPFRGVGHDPDGRAAIDWGVTAPPETFIVDGEGRVLFRFVGPLVGSDFRQRFLPELEKAAGNRAQGD